MQEVRPATPEEVKSIESYSDLDETCAVFALDTPQGTILAVRRLAVEIDPLLYPEGLDNRWKVIFARDIAHILMGGGVTKYYFNAPTDDEKWLNVIEKYGAERVSRAPEHRYKKVLIRAKENGN